MSKKGRELAAQRARDLGPLGVLRVLMTAMEAPGALSVYRAKKAKTFTHEVALSYDVVDAMDVARAMLEASPAYPATPMPIPMILTCPACGERHVDVGEFATKAHHTHACQSCGMVWRPAKVNTVGVQFLPGYKDPE